ncbi:MAG: OprD family outer membrane porin [Campylobacter sp.]|nr:OprD family outer membrane porin [Campylobacter sp.]
MQKHKMSLTALLALGLWGGVANAADSLVEALKGGTPSVELRAWYYMNNAANSSNNVYNHKGSIGMLNLGAWLGYVTDEFYGFSLGALVQSNFSPWASDRQKDYYAADLYGSGAVFSELYLKYNLSNTQIKVGRQFIDTPLLGGSDARMVWESFQGVTIDSKDIPDTRLFAAYIDKFQGRTTYGMDRSINKHDSDIGKFGKRFNLSAGGIMGQNSLGFYGVMDDVYSVLVENKSIENFRFMAQYTLANDYNTGLSSSYNGNAAGRVNATGDIHMLWAEAEYKVPFESFALSFYLNLIASRTSSALDQFESEGEFWLGKIGIQNLNGFIIDFAYSTTGKNDNVVYGVGWGPHTYMGTPYFGSGPAVSRNTDSYSVSVMYDMSKIGINGLRLWTMYGVHKQDNNDLAKYSYGDVKTQRAHISLDYKVPAANGLRVRLGYEQEKLTKDIGDEEVKHQMRLMAQYKF